MLEDPLPLERDLIDALSPERFGRTIDRDIRR
jgi:hypothetical protein